MRALPVTPALPLPPCGNQRCCRIFLSFACSSWLAEVFLFFRLSVSAASLSFHFCSPSACHSLQPGRVALKHMRGQLFLKLFGRASAVAQITRRPFLKPTNKRSAPGSGNSPAHTFDQFVPRGTVKSSVQAGVSKFGTSLRNLASAKAAASLSLSPSSRFARLALFNYTHNTVEFERRFYFRSGVWNEYYRTNNRTRNKALGQTTNACIHLA